MVLAFCVKRLIAVSRVLYCTEIISIGVVMSKSFPHRLCNSPFIKSAGFGGEAISLAINSSISTSFAKAGYTDMKTNASYTMAV